MFSFAMMLIGGVPAVTKRELIDAAWISQTAQRSRDSFDRNRRVRDLL